MLRPFLCTIVLIISAVSYTPQQQILLSIIIASLFHVFGFFSVAIFAKLMSVFCIPILFIHTVINANFEITNYIYFLPVRGDGFRFSLEVIGGISLITTTAMSWYSIPRDKFIDLLIYLRMPISILTTASISISIIHQIPRYANQIIIAQKSRGLSPKSSIFARLRGVFFVILPLISRLIHESETRAICLVSRGFGSRKMSFRRFPITDARDSLLCLIVASIGAACLAI